MEIRTEIHNQLVKFLVQKQITCPRTGFVLDVRTCVVLLDGDGNPAAVLSQQGWRDMPDEIRANVTAAGYTVDPDTVREPAPNTPRPQVDLFADVRKSGMAAIDALTDEQLDALED